MQERKSLTLLALLGLLVPYVLSTCVSYGSDYVDQGGPYCINTLLSDYWSFGSMFEGCSASDVQGTVTPIVVDPNTNEYFCSDIAVDPDDTAFVSTCNVAGWEITKNNMVSGVWTVVIEGLTFAYQRSFNIIAAPPVVVVSTPTATFTVTTTPTTTVTSTNTILSSTTLATVTVTSPSSTITKTSTVLAGPTTIWSTMTMTKTVLTLANSVTIKPLTTTTSCKTAAPAWDPTKTIQLTITQSTSSGNGTHQRRTWLPPAPTGGYWGGHFNGSEYNSSDWRDGNPWRNGSSWRNGTMRERGLAFNLRREEQKRALLPRTAGDLCTITSVNTDLLVSTTTTVTDPASTSVTVVTTTSTTTITPSPVTVFSGATTVTTTTTKAGFTFTFFTVTATTTTLTRTMLATVTSIFAVPPSGVACIKT